MMRCPRNRWICTGAMLWVAAGCGGATQAGGIAPRGTDAAARAGTDATRGMEVELPSWGAPPGGVAEALPGAGPVAPFVLEARLRARRMVGGRMVTFDEVRNGDVLMDGDRMQLSVRTSEDGYLYLAFCSQHAMDPRYQGLRVFPDSGGIRMIAHQTTIAPASTAEIVLDNHPGRETLYLILSRSELSHADSGLAAAIAAARRQRKTADCGTVAGRRARQRHRPWNGGRASTGPRAQQDPGRDGPAVSAGRAAPEKPVVGIERGGDIIWNGGAESGVAADPDGIVVLRYELEHARAR